MPDPDRMPPRAQVDPAFDGHPERPFAALTVEERLAWIWTTMTLLRAARRRAADATKAPTDPD